MNDCIGNETKRENTPDLSRAAIAALGEKFDYISVSPKANYLARYLEGSMLHRANEVRVVAEHDDLVAFCRTIRARIQADDYYISPLEQDGRIHYRRALTLLEKVNKASPDLLPPWALSIQTHKVLGIR